MRSFSTFRKLFKAGNLYNLRLAVHAFPQKKRNSVVHEQSIETLFNGMSTAYNGGGDEADKLVRSWPEKLEVTRDRSHGRAQQGVASDPAPY